MTDNPENLFDPNATGNEGEYPEPFFTDPDPGSVLFSGSNDTDPEYLFRVPLNEDGTIFANVYSSEGEYNPSSLDLFNLRDLLGMVDDDERRFHFEATEPPVWFDADDPDVRGPFPDEDSAIDWLNETGLWDIASWYYDDETGEWYIELYA